MKKKKLSLEKLEPVFEKIAKLTKVQRMLISLGALIVLIGPYVWLFYLPKSEEISTLTADYEKLQTDLQNAKRKAAMLPKYRKMLKDAEGQFALARQKLPQAKEIPNLLASITASGQAAGLEFESFKPNKEASQGFYAEIPVSIVVTGKYRNIAVFFEKVAELSRIVNLRNISMTPKEEKLTTSCTAVTYMFVGS